MSEYWGKDIISARLKFKNNDIVAAVSILNGLLDSKYSECIKESKKLLAQIYLQSDDKKNMAKVYLEEIFKDEKSTQVALDLMILSSQFNGPIEAKRYYLEALSLLDSDNKYNRTLLTFIYLSTFPKTGGDFSEALSLITELINDYKKISILDHHFLVTRNLPSFYDFLKQVEQLYIRHNKKYELNKFLNEQLKWVDESGKDVIQEILVALSE